MKLLKSRPGIVMLAIVTGFVLGGWGAYRVFGARWFLSLTQGTNEFRATTPMLSAAKLAELVLKQANAPGLMRPAPWSAV